MKLKELLADMPIAFIKSGEPLLEQEIQGVTKDSREVREGYVFFATGASKPYLSTALERKAAAIVSDELLPGNIPCLVVTGNVRLLLARMAAKFYGFPSRQLSVTGITGTNGKTTITYLAESIVHAAGEKVGVIGTISYRYNNHALKAPNTTPESVDTQSLLRAMKDEGIGHAVMEVSSHALDQGRVEDVDFDRVIFTNLTHDHLDYHRDFEHYREAKALLFHRYLRQSTKERKYAIINIDDDNASYLIPAAPVKTLFYSTRKDADACLNACKEAITGLTLEISVEGRRMTLSTPLIGLFNVSNILAAVLFGHSSDFPIDVIRKGIESLPGVPGRLERVASDRPINIFVDYAHTPDALKKTMETLNHVRSGRLIVVFGCGGDRDRTKRPVMGRIASQLADFAVLTSDNPRKEDPLAIMEEIRSGMTGNSFRVIENRKSAIEEALAMAGETDVVLVAGKGHEEYQIIGNSAYPFSDRAVIEECLHVGP
jgi:UDP-N-acetylmuramoyl-L-alanyl-D-glutamate--2,6-diaminopimelate ligase